MGKKLLKIFVIELMIIAIIFTLIYSNNKLPSNISFQGIFENVTSSSFGSKILNTLNIDKNLEDELRESLKNGNEFIVIRDKALFKTPDEIFEVLNKVVNSDSEIMYYSSVEYINGRLKINYSKSKEVLKDNQLKLQKKRDKIVEKIIEESMSDYEKTKIIHDYIVNNSRYDERLFTERDVPPESYTAYGNLVLGVGVCEGYAKSMKYLLDKVGVESIVVVGNSKNQNHAWNLVKIDDEYYHIDATWDDPISDNGENIIQYNYFNLTDEEISKTHKWNRDEYPLANGKMYNYFSYNKLLIYSKQELLAKIKDTLINRKAEILFKYESYKEDNISINNIIEDIAYNNYKLIKLKSYSYSIDENHGIFKVNFYYH